MPAALDPDPETPAAIRPFVHEIVEAACVAFGIGRNEVMSDRRDRAATRARQAAMFLAKEMTPLSLPQIGRLLNRDHTTVIHAARVMPQLIADDGLLAAKVRRTRRLAALRATVRSFRA